MNRSLAILVQVLTLSLASTWASAGDGEKGTEQGIKIADLGDGTVLSLGRGPTPPIHVRLSYSKRGLFPALITLDGSHRVNDIVDEIFDSFRKKAVSSSKQIRCAAPVYMAPGDDEGRCIFALESSSNVAGVAKLDAIRDQAETSVDGTALADVIDRYGSSIKLGDGVLTSLAFAGFNFRMGGEAAVLLLKNRVNAFDCHINSFGKPNCWFWMDRHGIIHPGQLSDHLQM